MPFYKSSELETVTLASGSAGEFQPVAGDLMKASLVTFRREKGSVPHWHEKEEQFILVLEGRRYMLVGDEERVIGPGDLVHIPPGTLHSGRTIDEKALVFVVKSPAEDKNLGADQHFPPDAAEIAARLESKARELGDK